MDRIKKEDLELLYGKMIAEKELSILGFKDKFKFEVYDGFAYCTNYKGCEYCMKYPKIEFVNKSTDAQKMIRDFINLLETDDITIFEILQSFNELSKDGVWIEYDEKSKHWNPKEVWLAFYSTT